SGFQSGSVGDAVEPVRDLLGGACRGLADENEESCLKGVLGVVVTAEEAAAHPPDHRPVPADQGREGRFFAVGQVAIQALAVGHPRRVTEENGPANTRKYLGRGSGRHVVSSVAASLVS